MSDGAADARRIVSEAGELVGSGAAPFPDGLASTLYRHVRRIRRLDERMIALSHQGRIGFYGACTGQEAVPAGAALALSPEDWVFPALRESSVLLIRGFPLTRYLAQLFGNSLDVLKGRQMPSHHASRRFRQVSWSSCIATQLPHAVGAAMAARRSGGSDAMLAFLGDGATSHPDFHAALNFAGVFRAPVVFVCQNNHYAISVPAARQTAAVTFAVKARAYGVASDRVDGNDALVVYDAVRAALESARRGAGATLIECVTYRLGPHSSSDDPSRYRTEDELARFRAREPIHRLKQLLGRQGAHTPELDTNIDGAMDEEIDRALAQVENMPAPALETLFEDVYAGAPWPLREQRTLALRNPPAATPR